MPRKKPTPKPRDRGISRGEDARTDRDPRKVGFLPDVLDSTVIALPLLKQFKERDAGTRSFHVAIDLNLVGPDPDHVGLRGLPGFHAESPAVPRTADGRPINIAFVERTAFM